MYKLVRLEHFSDLVLPLKGLYDKILALVA